MASVFERGEAKFADVMAAKEAEERAFIKELRDIVRDVGPQPESAVGRLIEALIKRFE